MYKKSVKRTFDFSISLTAILIMSPLMMLIFVLIKLESKGPAVFVSKRMGKNAVPFNCYKFRTMKQNVKSDVASRNIDTCYCSTKIGKFLRKTSLDELPQLFNILKNEMSFIGPRPVVLSETDLIKERIEYNVYDILPGLTGWAQINGRDEIVNMHQKAKYDAFYRKHISFKLDLKIFFKTIALVITKKGIVESYNAIELPKYQNATNNFNYANEYNAQSYEEIA